MLSSGHARKSDEADAVSVGIAALNAAGLHRVEIDEAISALRAVIEHRDDLVKTPYPDNQSSPRAAGSSDPGRRTDESHCRCHRRAATTCPIT